MRCVAIALVGALACAPAADAAGGGGAPASTTAQAAGGPQYGQRIKKPAKPVATRFEVGPSPIVSGVAPRIRLRIDDHWGGALRARLVFQPHNGSQGKLLQLDIGQVRPGRTVTVKWPSKAKLAAGHYTVRLHAVDKGGRSLRRPPRRTGRTQLRVTPPPATPKPAPLAPVTPVNPAGTFPVAGSHTYGDGFGAGREGHTHEGVDILAAEGTPVVAPVAGVVRFTDYQASAAGYYVVEYANDGRAFFFAHCQKDSFGTAEGGAVAQGGPICLVGHTGDATGPHLHFELWPNGWRDIRGTAPVDPLPQLRAWDTRRR